MFNAPPGCKDLYEQRRLLPIPGIIDYYNHYIGAVDIADQLRAKFTTAQHTKRSWLPLFYWLLDTSIINAYLISEHARKASLGSGKDKAQSCHRAFCEQLVDALLLLYNSKVKSNSQIYITKNTLLPTGRFDRPIELHRQLRAGGRHRCTLCRWERNRLASYPASRSMAKNLPVHRTGTFCSYCSVPLCVNCFADFHRYVK